VIPKRAVIWLIVGALGLPIAICILAALALLLYAMHDGAGGACVGRVGIGLFVLWILNLVGLVVIQAINSLGDSPRDSEKEL
jgi:hypothetical protein